MNAQPKLIAFLFLLFVGTLIGCSKDDETKPTDDSEAGNISGMGDSEGELKGTAFHFPGSVEIEGGIVGTDDIDDEFCKTLGSGLPVMLQFSFVNNTGKDTVLVFPAGLTFRSKSLEDQHGILLQEVAIALAKGAICKTMVYTYCINANRHASSESSRYEFGPVTDAKPMQELIGLLKNKVINYEAMGSEEAPSTFLGLTISLQQAVWNITEMDGLTQEDREFINALPGK